MWRGQPPLCMTGSRVGSQLSSAQAQPLREGQINNACLRGPMRPGHYFDWGEPLDRSSACSAKRSYSFATLSTACLACSFVRRSASSRFSLARSRQCSGSLIKEAGTFLQRTAIPGVPTVPRPSCAAHGVQEQISCGHSLAELGRHGAMKPAGRARGCNDMARGSRGRERAGQCGGLALQPVAGMLAFVSFARGNRHGYACLSRHSERALRRHTIPPARLAGEL